MSSESGASASVMQGVTTEGLLLVLFVALKLTHVIAWSWLWVLAPMWIPLAIAVVVAGIFGIGVGIVALFK